MTIETPNGKLIGVEVVFGNEGRYVRSRYDDGRTENDVVDALQDLPLDTSDTELIGAALLWVMPPDGLSSEELSDLRDSIEVRR